MNRDTNQLRLCTEMIAVCCEIGTKVIDVLYGRVVQCLVLKVLHMVTARP
jgi:hypothetical protein